MTSTTEAECAASVVSIIVSSERLSGLFLRCARDTASDVERRTLIAEIQSIVIVDGHEFTPRLSVEIGRRIAAEPSFAKSHAHG